MVKSKKMFLVFMFGIFAGLTWLSIMPHNRVSAKIVGGCPSCLNTTPTSCARTGKHCSQSYSKCTGSSDDLICSNTNRACTDTSDCFPHDNQGCNN